MDGTQHSRNTVKLIRCNVTNNCGERSVRHVYFDEFLLWEHLMISKHDAEISDVSLCVWVSGDEFSRVENIYQHAGSLESVDRIVVDLFDEQNGFSNTITRFVMSDESRQMREIILSHIPAERRKPNLCQVSVDCGTCVQKFRHSPDRDLILGMHE